MNNNFMRFFYKYLSKFVRQTIKKKIQICENKIENEDNCFVRFCYNSNQTSRKLMDLYKIYNTHIL